MSNSNRTTTQSAAENQSVEETEPFRYSSARVLVKIAGAVLLLLLVTGSVSSNISVLTDAVMIGLAVVLAVIVLVGAAVAELAYEYALAHLGR